MTELSPAAQAVKDAVIATYANNLPPKSIWALEQAGVAAALRAAADQVVPKPIRLPRNSYAEGAYDQRLNDHQRLLAIAAELEGQ
jgi:hypothetical protein